MVTIKTSPLVMNPIVRSFAVVLAAFSFTACDREDDEKISPKPTITIHGSDYPTVAIGTQTWTSTNYAGPGGVAFDAENSKPEYGRYYSKAELEAISLPEGWRIPTREDYTKLAQFYGITIPSQITDTEKIASLISETNWNNASGTNSSGFTAYPAGYIFGSAAPIDGDIAEFWTSEGVTASIQEAGANLTSLRMIFYQSDDSPDYKFNVRFVKD